MTSTPASSEPFELRITNHGKIRNFVSFALKFIQENPSRPLVLHTLPAKGGGREKDTAEEDQQVDSCNPEEEVKDSDSGRPINKQRLSISTTTIPRLITIAEIAKREYAEWAKKRRNADGSVLSDDLRLGLHQYNQLETLDNLSLRNGPETDLTKALSGKNHLKQDYSPHLRITLSVSALPALEIQGATHQPPPPLVKSKSARAREKRREKKRLQAAGALNSNSE